MAYEHEDDPHRCAACHEEPDVHIGRFGLNCARCHSAVAWTPAVLTRHTFLLNHGSEENLTCETCHAENYYTHSCYTCHDHTPEQMEQVHLRDEGLAEYANCIECHPTGAPEEARQYMPEHLTSDAAPDAPAPRVSSSGY